MLVDNETDKIIQEQWQNLADPVRKVILHGVYKEAISTSIEKFGLDEEARASVMLEVLFYLIGLQNRAALQNALTDHPVMTSVQGKELFEALDKKLFAPLTIYLDGAEVGGVDAQMLTMCIDSVPKKYERLSQLPESVRVVVTGETLGDDFLSIVKKHGLRPQQAQLLAQQVSTVLVGLGTTNDFKVNVTRDAGLESAVLEALFLDVESKLFKPVRTAILTALAQKKATGGNATASTSSSDPYRSLPRSQ